MASSAAWSSPPLPDWGAAVFDVFCPREGTQVLLTTRHILALCNRSPGVEVRYRCVCGHEGIWRPRSGERQDHVAG